MQLKSNSRAVTVSAEIRDSVDAIRKSQESTKEHLVQTHKNFKRLKIEVNRLTFVYRYGFNPHLADEEMRINSPQKLAYDQVSQVVNHSISKGTVEHGIKMLQGILKRMEDQEGQPKDPGVSEAHQEQLQQVDRILKAAEQLPEQIQRGPTQEDEAGLEEDKHEQPLSEKTEGELSAKAQQDNQIVFSPVRMDDEEIP